MGTEQHLREVFAAAYGERQQSDREYVDRMRVLINDLSAHLKLKLTPVNAAMPTDDSRVVEDVFVIGRNKTIRCTVAGSVPVYIQEFGRHEDLRPEVAVSLRKNPNWEAAIDDGAFSELSTRSVLEEKAKIIVQSFEAQVRDRAWRM